MKLKDKITNVACADGFDVLAFGLAKQRSVKLLLTKFMREVSPYIWIVCLP
jgi:hypothetical protein